MQKELEFQTEPFCTRKTLNSWLEDILANKRKLKSIIVVNKKEITNSTKDLQFNKERKSKGKRKSLKNNKGSSIDGKREEQCKKDQQTYKE